MSAEETPARFEDGWQDQKLVLAQEIRRAGDASDASTLALRYAALSSKFMPDEALAAAGLGDAGSDMPSMERLAAITNLSNVCDTRLWRPHWIMRTAPRSRIMTELAERKEEVAEWRRAQLPFDDRAQQIVAALVGEGPYAPDAVAKVLEDSNLAAEECRKLIRGITFTLPIAPAADQLDGLRAALARAESSADPEAKLVESGIFGRDAEIATISQSIAAQWENHAARNLAMIYVGGIGGVGKSTLLTEIRRRHRAPNTICLTLDFDRPGIEGGDPLGLSRDLARQVAELVGAPGASLFAAIAASSASHSPRGGSDRTQSQTLLDEVAQVMQQQGLAMLLTLDTLESLTLHGDSAAFELVEWLRILKQLLPKLAIIGAGREAMPVTFAEQATALSLTGLPDEASRKLLAALGVTGRAAEELIPLAAGNPLVLRLGARAALESGDAFSAAGEISPNASAQMKAGQLYRLILSRIESTELRALAHPGLLLRQINAAMLIAILAPELGIPALSETSAQDLLDRLKAHAWLVEERNGWLYHRPELRAVLLDLQIEQDTSRARRIFQKAAAWHLRNRDNGLALYYRLQAMRWSAHGPQIERESALGLTRSMIEELPANAQDLVAVARGERSKRLRRPSATGGNQIQSEVEQAPVGAAPSIDDGIAMPAPPPQAAGTPMPAPMPPAPPADPGFDMSAAAELRMLLDRRAYAEATMMVSRAGDLRNIDPGSSGGAAVIEALWRLGDWPKARALLGRRVKPAAFPDSADAMRLAPAFADMKPESFREILRDRPEWGRQVAAFIARQDPRALPDWDVAGLLLRAEGIQGAEGFARAVWTLWTGDPLTPEEIKAERDRLLRLASSSRPPATASDQQPTIHDLLAMLMPDPAHAAMVQNRIQSLRSGQIEALPPLAQATLNALGRTAQPASTAASFAIDQVDAQGALAHFLTALAVQQPGSGMQHLALAARRRMAAAAGHWTYGDVPEGWRQPVTDWRTLLALAPYSGTVDTVQAQATVELNRWRTGYGLETAGWLFAPLVKRATDMADATPLPLLGAGAVDLPLIAQKMIERGVPLALVPPLAALAQSRSPLAATPSPVRPTDSPA
jgi:hypothetical protein